ncbi:MAG: 50S ribosomal protein L6 [Phycisphaerales bacterium]|nr:50S ribosomal protein L6 [Phycisphaerales bacterium]
MSRIGKKPVAVPAGVKVSIKDHTVNIEGPKGKLSLTHRPEVKVAWTESEKSITCSIDEKDAENRLARALWGSTRAHLRNMVEGVTKGYERSLEVVGVGWTAAVQGKKLKLSVGFANPIFMDIPDGVTVAVDKQIVKVSGPDKQQVMQFASATRAKRKPEPYNGKGVKYLEEVIKKKQGKQFGA